MKLIEVKEEEKHVFKPIVFKMTIDNLEEARLLFHVLNHPNLRKLLSDDSLHVTPADKPLLAVNFRGLNDIEHLVADVVKKAIQDRGYIV